MYVPIYICTCLHVYIDTYELVFVPYTQIYASTNTNQEPHLRLGPSPTEGTNNTNCRNTRWRIKNAISDLMLTQISEPKNPLKKLLTKTHVQC